MSAHLETARARLGLAVASLDALSPLAVLQRGYSITETADGQLLRDAGSVSRGDKVGVRLSRGRIAARVEEVEINDH
jgi:exodeoxyribonuclease VII large subunit